MEQGLQKLNGSSGKGVKHCCQENSISKKTYYYWQRRIFKMAQDLQTPEFAELHSFAPVSAVAASLEISGANVQVYAGADESTLSALFRALSSC